MSIGVLVVDDSAVFGRILKQALQSIAGVEVAGLCRSGAAALDRLRADPPDAMTLDVEMPGMNGLEVLQAMRREGIKTPVILLSSADDRARDLTLHALELGALDFVPKPQAAGAEEGVDALRERLSPLLAAVAHRKEVRTILHAPAAKPPAESVQPAHNIGVEDYGKKSFSPPLPRPEPPACRLPPHPAKPRTRPAMVLIGVSTGGPEALVRIIPRLPGTLRVPVLIVQHMPPLFTQTLAQKLDSCSALRVKEAEDGETAVAGRVYLAPGGKHMKVMMGLQREPVLRITSDPPENNCRPAVDVLFRSAAAAFPGLCVAVILTGMGRDGTRGLRELRAHGVMSIAQDEATCTVFGMPKEAIQAGLVDVVVPLPSIASEIVKAIC